MFEMNFFEIFSFHKILSWQAGVAEELQWGPPSAPCSTDIVPSVARAFRELAGHDGAAWLAALVTSCRCGVSDADAERLCRARATHAHGPRCWPALLHVLAPFVRRVLVGGVGLWSWRDAAIRRQMADALLADAAEALAVHRALFAHFWAEWQAARQRLERAQWADLASPQPDSTQLRCPLLLHFLDTLGDFLFKISNSS